MAKSTASTKKSAEKAVKKARIEVPAMAKATKQGKAAAPAPIKSALKSKKSTPGPSTQHRQQPPTPVVASAKIPAPTTSFNPNKKGKGKPKSTDDVPDVLPTTFKVIAGSYEKLLYGLNGTTSVNEDGNVEYHLKPMFIFPAHVSCIKAVAASPQGGKWLATGSADEIIKIWDLRRRKEIGGLMHHEGSITHLSFPSRSYLLSASEDGTMCLFRARDWAVLRSLKGHKGRVNAVAVHPSGKVALTVGKDRTLRMWDLMRGKGCASTKIGKEGETAQWSSDGSLFAVQAGSTIDLYSTDMTLLHSINHPSRLHDIRFCKTNSDDEVLLVAAEDNKVSVYSLPEDREKAPTIFAQLVGHENRVKAVQILQIALPTGCNRKSTSIAATASSDGKIHVYDINDVPSATSASKAPAQISPVAQYNSDGTRLTCLTLADGDSEDQLASGKRKREEEDEDEGEHKIGSDEDEEIVEEGDDNTFSADWEDEEEGKGEDEGEDEDEAESD